MIGEVNILFVLVFGYVSQKVFPLSISHSCIVLVFLIFGSCSDQEEPVGIFVQSYGLLIVCRLSLVGFSSEKEITRQIWVLGPSLKN